MVKDIFLSNLGIWRHQYYPSGQAPKFPSCLRRSSCSLEIFFLRQKTFSSWELNLVYLFRDLSLPGKWETLQALLVPGKLNMGHNRLNRTDFLFLSPFPPFLTPTHLLPPGVVDDEGVHPESQNLTKPPLKSKHLSKMAQFQQNCIVNYLEEKCQKYSN